MLHHVTFCPAVRSRRIEPASGRVAQGLADPGARQKHCVSLTGVFMLCTLA